MFCGEYGICWSFHFPDSGEEGLCGRFKEITSRESYLPLSVSLIPFRFPLSPAPRLFLESMREEDYVWKTSGPRKSWASVLDTSSSENAHYMSYMRQWVYARSHIHVRRYLDVHEYADRCISRNKPASWSFDETGPRSAPAFSALPPASSARSPNIRSSSSEVVFTRICLHANILEKNF